jgi:hypothetical protein
MCDRGEEEEHSLAQQHHSRRLAMGVAVVVGACGKWVVLVWHCSRCGCSIDQSIDRLVGRSSRLRAMMKINMNRKKNKSQAAPEIFLQDLGTSSGPLIMYGVRPYQKPAKKMTARGLQQPPIEIDQIDRVALLLSFPFSSILHAAACLSTHATKLFPSSTGAKRGLRSTTTTTIGAATLSDKSRRMGRSCVDTSMYAEYTHPSGSM